jgi:phosphoglucomutase
MPTMNVHPLAGKAAPEGVLVDIARLEREYYERRPELQDSGQRVCFGTSGHRGSSLHGTFTEAHVLAITQAICDYRRTHKISGPNYLGKDTHALSALAQRTALEVLAGNDVDTMIQQDEGPTPTPVISHAILVHNEGRHSGLADGIIITPSHNPPEDGGLKYNPPHGGPAEAEVTKWVEERANKLLRGGNRGVKRVPFAAARKAAGTHQTDFVGPYVKDLKHVVDVDAIHAADLSMGVDPMGGASVHYWERIAEMCRVRIKVVNPQTDPTFRFMTLDHDGKIRMDCSSPYAMAGLLKLKHRYSVAFANDPDADRHGIVTASAGLMNPNHFLAVAIDYLLANRPVWRKAAAVGKTVVSSGLIDAVVKRHGRALAEVPVGFKWFAAGLYNGSICFAGEESVWTTDKDGILLALLAGEITARTGKEPGLHYQELTASLGTPFYTRLDAPATPEQKAALGALSAELVTANSLAGDPIISILTNAPANQQPIGGLKVVTNKGWFAARPSGTENICKIYAESFVSSTHLDAIVAEAQEIVSSALAVRGKGPGNSHEMQQAAT